MGESEYIKLIKKFKEDNKEMILKGKIKKIFIEFLPKFEIGTNKGKINWENSIEYKICFIYKNIENYIKIISYDSKRRYLMLEYNNNIYNMYTGNFIKCKLGKILGVHTGDFKVELKQIFKDNKRDLIIIDREYGKDKNGTTLKYYKYHCNKDGYEDWIEESCLLKQKHGCSLCFNQVISIGINSIADTNPEMIKYFVGGIEEAKLYTAQSNKKIYAKCPDCGRTQNKKTCISSLYNYGLVCSCSDKTPYPEKIIFSALEQLGLDFQTQLSKTTFEWCKDYRYDFYFALNGEQYVVETHGNQHYTDAWDKLEKTQLNDKLKEELALASGIKKENYIIIDCRKSELEFIKQNILDSRLSDFFDLNKINWNRCEEFALSNRVKEACNLWNSGIHIAKEIAKIMRLSNTTITNYLNKGKIFDWCPSYNSKNILSEKNRKIGLSNGKQVEIFKNGISFGVFFSVAELERKSKELFNIKLGHTCISDVCNKKRELYKGFTFQYS